MIYVFVGTIGIWYPLSGSVTANYSYGIYFRNKSDITECNMSRLTGSGPQGFDGMRIYVIQSSNAISAKNKKTNESTKFVKTSDGTIYTDAQLRQMSYSEFCKALNISMN